MYLGYDRVAILEPEPIMPKSKKVALYARVSTDGQSTENQLRELRAAISRHGWTIVAEYVDRGVSGAKGRNAYSGEGDR